MEVGEGFLQEVAPSWAWKEKQKRRQVPAEGRAKPGLRVSLMSARESSAAQSVECAPGA